MTIEWFGVIIGFLLGFSCAATVFMSIAFLSLISDQGRELKDKFNSAQSGVPMPKVRQPKRTGDLRAGGSHMGVDNGIVRYDKWN